jgi:hypothetical protein
VYSLGAHRRHTPPKDGIILGTNEELTRPYIQLFSPAFAKCLHSKMVVGRALSRHDTCYTEEADSFEFVAEARREQAAGSVESLPGGSVLGPLKRTLDVDVNSWHPLGELTLDI